MDGGYAFTFSFGICDIVVGDIKLSPYFWYSISTSNCPRPKYHPSLQTSPLAINISTPPYYHPHHECQQHCRFAEGAGHEGVRGVGAGKGVAAADKAVVAQVRLNSGDDRIALRDNVLSVCTCVWE